MSKKYTAIENKASISKLNTVTSRLFTSGTFKKLLNQTVVNYKTILLWCLIGAIWSCKDSKSNTIVVDKPAPTLQDVYGIETRIVSKSGDLFENIPYLPLPLNHGVIEGRFDTLDILILARPIEAVNTKIVPYAYFEVKEGKNTRPFIVGLPSDTSMYVMPRQNFSDFMVFNYPIKNIIDTYFSNYKGQAKTRVTNWRETVYAEDVIKRAIR